jgi:hypothetical protein
MDGFSLRPGGLLCLAGLMERFFLMVPVLVTAAEPAGSSSAVVVTVSVLVVVIRGCFLIAPVAEVASAEEIAMAVVLVASGGCRIPVSLSLASNRPCVVVSAPPLELNRSSKTLGKGSTPSSLRRVSNLVVDFFSLIGLGPVSIGIPWTGMTGVDESMDLELPLFMTSVGLVVVLISGVLFVSMGSLGGVRIPGET